MWRFIILIAIAPILLGSILANLFGFSVLAGTRKLSHSVESLTVRLLKVIDREDIAVEFVKSPVWSHKHDRVLRISSKYQHSEKPAHVARVLIDLGLLLLHEKQPQAVEWRSRMVKLGYLLPVFTLLFAVFTFILAKIIPVVAVSVILGSLSLCSVMLWLSLSIEKEAAQLMVSHVEKLRILPRLSEEEDLVSALRATPWVSLIPGAILKFIQKN